MGLALALVAAALPDVARAIDFTLSLWPLRVREETEITLTLTARLERAGTTTLTVFVEPEKTTRRPTRGGDYHLLEWRVASSSEPAGWYEKEEGGFQFEVPPGQIIGAFEFRMRVNWIDPNIRNLWVNFEAGYESSGAFMGAWQRNANRVTIARAGFCGRSPLVQHAIIQALPTIDHCWRVTTSTLASLDYERLDLSAGGIRAFEPDDFAGLVNLRRLELNFNPSVALPAGIFDDLVSLETLYLGFSGFETLPAGLFDNLTRLERLSLTNLTELATLPAGLFDNLTRLERLNLSGNTALTALPAGLFDSLTRLEQLHLNSNALTTLPAGLLSGLTRLAWLRLSDNALDSLPANAFDDLVVLRELWLDGNRLSSLPDLASSTSLVLLDLGSNQLTSVPANAFRELTALTTLHLDRNRIAALHRDAFSSLGNLTELWLSYNNLKSLPAEVFDPLTALDTLELHSNDLAALPADAFDSLGGLTGLWLHDNQIGDPPAGVFHPLTSLTTLSLRDNRIQHLPVDTFLGLEDLEYLWLTGNPGAPFNGFLLEVADTTGGDIEITEAPEGDSFALSVSSSTAQGLRITIPKSIGIIRKVTLATLDTVPGGAEGESIRQEIRAAMDTALPTMVRVASSSQGILHVDVQGRAPGPLAAPVMLCLPYDRRPDEADHVAGVYRHAGGRWRLLGGRTDASEEIVCGATDTFSAFAVLLRAPRQLSDINWDYALDANDALILYYAFSLRSELGNGR